MTSIQVSNQHKDKVDLLAHIYSILLKRALKRKLRKQTEKAHPADPLDEIGIVHSAGDSETIDLANEDMRKYPGGDIIHTGGNSACLNGSQPLKPSNYPVTTPSTSAG